ncbi:hypothetical protein Mgra_00009200 [Meloidogyne graminicola]|uniref:Homeobox domain-containing protein n=1 Tax=Meloidogyne graminicola TaxID=189291 RepID=A0A8S9ZDK4_9BILA|nr:hypothetical protein Mgra_00009200 [Meloidogyne graminicola]
MLPIRLDSFILFESFVCICCGRPLQPGEQYMIGPIDGGYGKHFYLNPAILQQSKFPSEFNPLNCTTEQPNSSIENNLIYSRILPTSQENSKLNFNNEFIMENDNNYDSNTKTFTSSVGSITPESCGGTLSEDLAFGTNLSENGDSLSSSNNSQKLKRLRTSFKHTQLRTMKAYFFINHNPDSKDLKVLSTKTGLTKRLVSGQMQGAKYRRTQQHQLMGSSSSIPTSIHSLETQRETDTQQLITLSIGNNIGINNESYKNEQQ